MSYVEKLQDPRWQKKRLEILERDKFQCLNCGSESSTLHVHHEVYLPGLEPWDYSQTLMTLCKDCHAQREELKKSLAGTCCHLKNSELVHLIRFIESTTGVKRVMSLECLE